MNGSVYMPGIYKHYKGNYYRVVGEARHSETEQWLVVYSPLATPDSLWVRPKDMFYEDVVIEAGDSGEQRRVPRFAFVGETVDSIDSDEG